MQPHRNRIGEIGLSNDDGCLAVTDCVLEHDKAGGGARTERYRGFARDGQRPGCVIGKVDYRICLNTDDVLLARDRVSSEVCRQHCRQALRYLDKVNGSSGGRACQLGRWFAIVGRIGNESEDRRRIGTGRQLQCHRGRRIKAKGERASFGDDELRLNGSAECREFSKSELSRPSTGKASSFSAFAVIKTGRRPRNSPSPRLTLVCRRLPNKAELLPVCASFIRDFHSYCREP